MPAVPSPTPVEPLPPQREVLAEAARWFVVLASGEASDVERRRWQDWHDASPAHAAAWQRAAACGECFAGLPAEQAALTLNVLGRRKPKSAGRSRRAASFASFVLASLLVFSCWQGYRASDWSADLVSAGGEQRETVLADGSRLMLDTDSAVDVDYSSQARTIHLRRGRLLLVSAHDPAPAQRPLRVDTVDGRVVALGTRFTVSRAADSTRVTVLEARVALRGEAQPGEAIIVGAGQSARFDRRGLLEQGAAAFAEDAWTRGMLVADDLRLDEVLTRIGLYRSDLVVCDAAVAGLRVSGTFPLRDTDRALAALAETLPVVVVRELGGDGVARLTVRHK